MPVIVYNEVFLCVVSVESQQQQAEERAGKLKQILVKTKKDLADARKVVSHQVIINLSGLFYAFPDSLSPKLVKA